jgi:hypothetical protein
MSPNDPGIATINVQLVQAAHVLMEVLDSAGKRLWSTQLLNAAPGVHQILFDGRDRHGRPLKGTYFYRISVNGATVTRKMNATSSNRPLSHSFTSLLTAAHGYLRAKTHHENENGQELLPARFSLSPRR